jgi:hypothetical protein
MYKTSLVKMTSIFTLALCAIFMSLSVNAAGLKPTEITVAYIQQWPAPNQSRLTGSPLPTAPK